MAEQAGKDVGIDQRLLHRVSDPTHLDMLLSLNEGPAGPGGIADRLGIDPDAAAGHLEQMRRLGLVEVIGTRTRQGRAETHYRALVRGFWKDEDWARLGLEQRQRMIAWTLGVINGDACEALASGSFAARADSHLSRSISLVDEQGWRELCRIQEEALEGIFAVQATSAERLAERGEEGVNVMSAMICCELPESRSEGD